MCEIAADIRNGAMGGLSLADYERQLASLAQIKQNMVEAESEVAPAQ